MPVTSRKIQQDGTQVRESGALREVFADVAVTCATRTCRANVTPVSAIFVTKVAGSAVTHV
jgi:hypothetical protein